MFCFLFGILRSVTSLLLSSLLSRHKADTRPVGFEWTFSSGLTWDTSAIRYRILLFRHRSSLSLRVHQYTALPARKRRKPSACFAPSCVSFGSEHNCVITGSQRQFVVMQRTLEIPPGNLQRDLSSGDVSQTNADLGAPLSRMPVASVHLADLL